MVFTIYFCMWLISVYWELLYFLDYITPNNKKMFTQQFIFRVHVVKNFKKQWCKINSMHKVVKGRSSQKEQHQWCNGWSAVDRGFEPTSGQAKDYNIGICYFSSKHAVLRSKNKDCLARNQNNVSEWSDMSTGRLLFQWASTMKKNN